MTMDLKKWATLGVGTALLGAGLVACAPGDKGADKADSAIAGEAGEAASGEAGEGENGEGEGGEAGEAATGEAGEGEAGETGEGEAGEGEGGEAGEGEGGEAGEGEGGEAGEGEGGEGVESLPLPNRLAFMSGHVKAGLALYRAGAPDAAAPHLLHPVSESYEGERAGLDELGFDPALFEAVSAALEAGQSAEEIEPQLAAAEANLSEVADAAGGNPAEIIQYLMEVLADEYTIAITDGAVSDPGEYQDAWGFAVVARELAQDMDGNTTDLLRELDALVALWPEAPIPTEAPAPIAQIIAQTSAVVLALP